MASGLILGKCTESHIFCYFNPKSNRKNNRTAEENHKGRHRVYGVGNGERMNKSDKYGEEEIIFDWLWGHRFGCKGSADPFVGVQPERKTEG